MNTINNTIPIMLVEDNELDVKLMQRYLKKSDISNPFYTAWDGVEALEHLRGVNGREKVPQPCLILLDINMPRMDGFEFIETIKHDDNTKQNVVIMLTTSSREEDISRAYDLCAAGYIVKDNMRDLPDFIAEYLDINEFPTA